MVFQSKLRAINLRSCNRYILKFIRKLLDLLLFRLHSNFSVDAVEVLVIFQVLILLVEGHSIRVKYGNLIIVSTCNIAEHADHHRRRSIYAETYGGVYNRSTKFYFKKKFSYWPLSGVVLCRISQKLLHCSLSCIIFHGRSKATKSLASKSCLTGPSSFPCSASLITWLSSNARCAKYASWCRQLHVFFDVWLCKVRLRHQCTIKK